MKLTNYLQLIPKKPNQKLTIEIISTIRVLLNIKVSTKPQKIYNIQQVHAYNC